MIGFDWVLWHISPCTLFNAKSSLYIFIKYKSFSLVGFDGNSAIVCYLMPNRHYTYLLNIHEFRPHFVKNILKRA